MNTKRIIPCLDVDAGRVVKGVQFVSIRDAGDPAECARAYNEQGADELVFLDITASSEARPILLEAVRKTAEEVFLPLTVGGGVRTVENARELLRAGADKVSLNTAAVERPELIREVARAPLHESTQAFPQLPCLNSPCQRPPATTPVRSRPSVHPHPPSKAEKPPPQSFAPPPKESGVPPRRP